MTYNQYGNNNGYNKGGYNNGGYQKQGGYNTQGNNQNKGNNNQNKVGAIWRKQTRNGSEYLSIVINGKNYVAFVNTYKNAPNQPDFNIMETQGGNNNNNTVQNNNQNTRYNQQNGYAQNKGYQAKVQQAAEQKIEDYYAAQNTPIQRNEYGQNTYTIESVDNIGDIPVDGNDGMPVF